MCGFVGGKKVVLRNALIEVERSGQEIDVVCQPTSSPTGQLKRAEPSFLLS